MPDAGLAAAGDGRRLDHVAAVGDHLRGEISTKCGKSGVNAFYCSADQQIYFSNLLPQAVPIVAEDKWAADVVMAHEFGHAIQGRTGLLISAHALAQNTDSKAGVEPAASVGWRPRPTASPACSCGRCRGRSGSSRPTCAGIQDTFGPWATTR